MLLFLGAVSIILRLFSKARGHLLFLNYSRNNLPKPTDVTIHTRPIGLVIIIKDYPNGSKLSMFTFESPGGIVSHMQRRMQHTLL